MLGLLAAPGTPAYAQWAPSTSCDQFGGYELENCLNKALATADATLNDTYKKAEAAITADSDASAEDKKTWLGNLVAAQRAWVAFRDANCKFDLIAAEWNSGSGTTSAQQACVLAATLARTTELQQRYTLSN
ncbi:lysozyme inhibitor LprI family protein [Oryzicola mucosus]|uniref:DUF1311 domain-containing protein n=1 Tax=Oryzicola mucosus TaxID=2767425 RepID=A0A8J6PW47_9HYPH|nr:lysozyme inhibitor LprI family protein [Oryzicola mucosus]MBD0415148.1 DUF1311 domain-containing protein [Oryzicola mucosus]